MVGNMSGVTRLSTAALMTSDARNDLFDFLCRKYVQRADDRQAAMGLQYMHAETHDLADEIIRWLNS